MQLGQIDIAVVGAGVAGIAAATALHRRGHRVMLIDAGRTHAREFRAEKFGSAEAALFERLGLWADACGSMTRFDEVWLGQWGKPTGRIPLEEYSVRFPDFMATLRDALPANLPTLSGRVALIETTPRHQHVVLADGSRIEARLVILATGLVRTLRDALGMPKITVKRAHSLVYGFDLAPLRGLAPNQSLTWRGERIGDGVAYVTLFPLGSILRANLFTHWDLKGPQHRAFSHDPARHLATLMPGLTRHWGTLAPTGDLDQRSVDLLATGDHRREGVVLIGDAFGTTCPSTGSGIPKALNDVIRLEAHVAQWLTTPGMGADKIAAFYDDPIKRAVDQAGLSASLVGRSMLMDSGWVWRFRRLRSTIYRRGRFELAQLGGEVSRRSLRSLSTS